MKSKRILIAIDPETKSELKKIAKSEDVSMSFLIRKAILAIIARKR